MSSPSHGRKGFPTAYGCHSVALTRGHPIPDRNAMSKITLEIGVDDAAGLQAAVDGGADRIALCSALAVGGLTPSAGQLAMAANSPIPVYAMIRPRAGDFVFTDADLPTMLADIDAVRMSGLEGVMLGATLSDGRLNRSMLEKLVAHAQGLGLTLHRAFDMAPDFSEALDLAVDLGFERILTSGGARDPGAILDILSDVVGYAGDRISVMPGVWVSPNNIRTLLDTLGVREISSTGRASFASVDDRAIALGFESPVKRVTDVETVRALKRATSEASAQISNNVYALRA